MKTKYNGYISESHSRGRSGTASRSPNMQSEAGSSYVDERLQKKQNRRVSSHKSSRLRLQPVVSETNENYQNPIPNTSTTTQKKVMFADELSSHQSRVKHSRSTLSSQSPSRAPDHQDHWRAGPSASPYSTSDHKMEYYNGRSPSSSDKAACLQGGSRYEIDKNVRAFESGYYSSSGNSTAAPAVSKNKSKTKNNRGDRELKNILI